MRLKTNMMQQNHHKSGARCIYKAYFEITDRSSRNDGKLSLKNYDWCSFESSIMQIECKQAHKLLGTIRATKKQHICSNEEALEPFPSLETELSRIALEIYAYYNV